MDFFNVFLKGDTFPKKQLQDLQVVVINMKSHITRKKHMTDMLKSIGIYDPIFINPYPANNKTKQRLEKLLNVERKYKWA